MICPRPSKHVVLTVFCVLILFNICIVSPNAFIFISDSKSWDQARSFCDSNYEGLASIVTEAEMHDAGSKTGGSISWIGLYFNGAWRWSDSSPCTVTPGTGHDCSDFWGSNEPSNDGYCVELVVSSKKLNDKPCAETRPFLCNIQS